MNQPIFTIEDLKNSKCVLVHDKTTKGEKFLKLKKIICKAFPNDFEPGGSSEFYYGTCGSDFWYCHFVDEEVKNLPKVSVDEFYSNNF